MICWSWRGLRIIPRTQSVFGILSLSMRWYFTCYKKANSQSSWTTSLSEKYLVICFFNPFSLKRNVNFMFSSLHCGVIIFQLWIFSPLIYQRRNALSIRAPKLNECVLYLPSLVSWHVQFCNLRVIRLFVIEKFGIETWIPLSISSLKHFFKKLGIETKIPLSALAVQDGVIKHQFMYVSDR